MLSQALYFGLAIPLADLLMRGMALRDPKLKRALRGRRLPVRMDDVAGPGVWFHVSSLGEFEQARPVIEAVRRRVPGAPVWVSFSSPSGLEHSRGYPHAVDTFYLPFRRAHLRRAFDVIAPRVIVIIRYDLWPGLVWEAAARMVPVVLADATLGPDSLRAHPLVRPFQRTFYRHLTHVLAVTEDDADRLRGLCGPSVPIEVAGDSRFDRVWERTRAPCSGALDHAAEGATRPLLVAGSTYEPEERALAEALTMLGGPSEASVILVPHEPTEERLSFAEELFGRLGWGVTRLSRLTPGQPWGVLLLDRVGILAECYRHADWVFVGGSFKGKVHNVMEPAAWGKPIVVGPHYRNSPEAVQMRREGALRAVADPAELASVLRSWKEDPGGAITQGQRARDFLLARRGASERIAEVIAALAAPR